MDTKLIESPEWPRSLKDIAREEGLGEGGVDPSIIDGLSAHELGQLGELLAIAYLQDRGYAVLEHSYRCVEGEADIIVHDEAKDEVVLVEVKTRRRTAPMGDELYPEEAVDLRKRTRYRRIAHCYVMEHYPVRAIRFDIVSVVVRCGCIAEIEHLHSAFDWEMER